MTQGGQLGHSGALLQNTGTPESSKINILSEGRGGNKEVVFFLACSEGKLSRAII